MKNPFNSFDLFRRGLAHFGWLTRSEPREEATTRGVPVRARRAEMPETPKPPAMPQSPAAPAKRPAAPVLPEEDPDSEMRGDSLAARARDEERARCKAIVMSEAGLKQPSLAYALAFHSTIPLAEAMALLGGADDRTFAHLRGTSVMCIEGKWVQSRALYGAQGASRYRPAGVN